jgi:hypothetical protein
LRIRRDFELLLNAIRTHAILHQASRERNAEGEIVATLDDFDAVRGLVGDVMSAAVATKIPPQMRIIVGAVDALLKDGAKPTQSALRDKTDFSRSQVGHWLRAAKGEGYLIDANEGQRGKPAALSLGADLPGDADLLPTTGALRDRLQNERDRVTGVTGEGVKAAGRLPEKVTGQLTGPPLTKPVHFGTYAWYACKYQANSGI